MRLEFVANAGFVIETSGPRIVTDPWLSSDGAFYGSWFNYPPVPDDVRERFLGCRPDVIYVSHLHQDHLDPATLGLFDRSTPVLIGRLPHDHLRRAVAALGFPVIEAPLGEPFEIDGVTITVLGQFSATTSDAVDEVDYALDTSLHVRDGDHSLLNVVDNPISVETAGRLRRELGAPTIAVLPFAGASAFPHAFDYSDDEKDAHTARLKQRGLDRLADLARALEPQIVVPAAGIYVLGGRTAPMTRWLHQAIPAELPGTVLGPGGWVDTSGDMDPRTIWFTEQDRQRYADSLADRPMAFDSVSMPNVPWPRLLRAARAKLRAAQERMGLHPAVDVELRLTPSPGVPGREPFRFSLNEERAEGEIVFTIDAALLLMVLLGSAVWNNAEAGSHIQISRTPDVYQPTVHSLMSYFTVV